MSPLIHTDIRNINKDEVAARFAVLECMQVGINKAVGMLREEFGYSFTRSYVEKLKFTEVYQRVVKEYNDTLVKNSVNSIRKKLVAMEPVIMDALENLIRKGNTQALAMGFKILGADASVEPEQKQAQSITVVLPGGKKIEKDVSDK